MSLQTRLVAAMCIVVSMAAAARAQRPSGGGVEVAILGGVTLLTYSGGDTHTELSLPMGSAVEALMPSLRLTFWTQSAFTMDASFGVIHASGGVDDVTLYTVEGGPSFAIKSGGSASPFFGAVVGVIGGDGGSTTFIGPQFGTRVRIREYAVVRVQAGYRVFIEDVGPDGVFEFAGGLGFFL